MSLGVEFYLTKRLNLTTQLTLPIYVASNRSYSLTDFYPLLDINLSYKFGGIKK